jgi:hypothetical protein
MTTISVTDFAQAGQFWTTFDGCNTAKFTITRPNGKVTEEIGLLTIANTWYINGPVADEWTVGTLGGPVAIPAGTIITIDKPAGAKAFRKPASHYKRIW